MRVGSPDLASFAAESAALTVVAGVCGLSARRGSLEFLRGRTGQWRWLLEILWTGMQERMFETTDVMDCACASSDTLYTLR